jgi:hypothetical protein
LRATFKGAGLRVDDSGFPVDLIVRDDKSSVAIAYKHTVYPPSRFTVEQMAKAYRQRLSENSHSDSMPIYLVFQSINQDEI